MDNGTETKNQPMVETIDIGKIEAMVDHSLVRKVGRLVARHTEEALSVVRVWMSEKA